MKRNDKVRVVMRNLGILLVAIGVAIFIAISLSSCGTADVQATQDTISPEMYIKSFEHGERFCIRLMLIENRSIAGETTMEEYEEFLDLYRKVFETAFESKKNFKKSQEEFSAFATEIFGENAYIEPQTDIDKSAFADSMLFYSAYDIVSLQYLYGTISEEQFKEIGDRMVEARENITHEKVIEFSDYAMEIAIQATFENDQSDQNQIGESA